MTTVPATPTAAVASSGGRSERTCSVHACSSSRTGGSDWRNALGEPAAAGLRADRPDEPVAVGGGELRRAAADVDQKRALAERPVAGDAAHHHLGLLARRRACGSRSRSSIRSRPGTPRRFRPRARRSSRRRACAPLRAPPPRAGSRRARSGPGRSRSGGGCGARSTDSPMRVIASRRATSSTRPCSDIGDEQACRIRAEVDGCDPHALTVLGDESFGTRCASPEATSAAAAREPQPPGRNQSRRRIAWRASRIACELHVELRPRDGEPLGDGAEPLGRGARAVEVDLDLRRRLGDSRRSPR